MFTAHRHSRSAALCALACTAVMAIAGGTAFARPAPEDLSPANSQAQEAYYMSYGEPQPVSSPAPTPPFDDTEFLVIGLACIAALGIAGATASQVRVIRARRRRTTRPAL